MHTPVKLSEVKPGDKIVFESKIGEASGTVLEVDDERFVYKLDVFKDNPAPFYMQTVRFERA